MNPPHSRNYSFPALFIAMTLACAAVVGALFAFCSVVRASHGYGLEARFDAMPDADREFTEWLEQQPGVVPHTVQVRRPDAKTLVVSFIMSRNLYLKPDLPDISHKCKQLGYTGPDGSFRDSATTGPR